MSSPDAEPTAEGPASASRPKPGAQPLGHAGTRRTTGWVLWWRDRPLLADAALAIGVMFLIAIRTTYGVEAGSRELGVPGYLLAFACAAPLAFRRRHPNSTLAAVALLNTVYHSINFPGGVTLPALWVALYSAAAAGRTVLPYSVATVFVLTATGFRTVIEHDQLLSVIGEAVVVVVVTMGGTLMHSHRALQAEVEARRAEEVERAHAQAERRIAEERLWLAREVHDVVAHTLTGIAVHAAAVDESVEADPAAARASAQAIRAASKEAVGELRTVLGRLRDPVAPRPPDGEPAPPADLAPQPSIYRIDDLVLDARQRGLTAELELADGLADRLPEVPSAVGRAAFRVVQEALTNTVRHARATRVAVRLAWAGGGLEVEVLDDGSAVRSGLADGVVSLPGSPTDAPGGGATAPGGSTGGHGLRGMRERVDALGGRFEAGPRPGNGFRVYAWLPL